MSPERKLDVSGNPFIEAIWSFVDEKLPDDGQQMKVRRPTQRIANLERGIEHAGR